MAATTLRKKNLVEGRKKSHNVGISNKSAIFLYVTLPKEFPSETSLVGVRNSDVRASQLFFSNLNEYGIQWDGVGGLFDVVVVVAHSL